MLHRTLSTFLIIILCIIFSTNAQESKKNKFIRNLSLQSNTSENEKFLAKSITFKSDISLSKEEFFYLTNLKPKSYITLVDLWKSYKQLKRKNRFYKIDISIKNTQQGRHIYFDLKANLMFKNVKIKMFKK